MGGVSNLRACRAVSSFLGGVVAMDAGGKQKKERIRAAQVPIILKLRGPLRFGTRLMSRISE